MFFCTQGHCHTPRDRIVNRTEEQVRPSSLPTPSFHGHSRSDISRIAGSTTGSLKPPPPLIQVSPSREKMTTICDSPSKGPPKTDSGSLTRKEELQYRELLLQHVKDAKVSTY